MREGIERPRWDHLKCEILSKCNAYYPSIYNPQDNAKTHTQSIKPTQSDQYKTYGIHYIQECGLNSPFELIIWWASHTVSYNSFVQHMHSKCPYINIGSKNAFSFSAIIVGEDFVIMSNSSGTRLEIDPKMRHWMNCMGWKDTSKIGYV